MKKILHGLILISIIISSCCRKTEISTKSLLHEIIDRETIAQWPGPEYQCLQASSYNRESVSPEMPGWFADSDGVSCIRTEQVNGNTEWVLMEDSGPGCITRIWAVCFYYGLNNTTGANIKIYLDGADEPVINTNFFKLVKGHDFIMPPFADSTARAGVLNFPIPYAKSCKVTMDKRVFYNIINYRKYREGTQVRTFSMQEFEETQQIREKVAQTLLTCPEAKGKTVQKNEQIAPGEDLSIELGKGNMAIKQIEIRIKPDDNYAQNLRSLVLVGEFDGEQTIWVPVGDFFCNVGKLKPYHMWERTVRDDGTMICRWVMPYSSNAVIRLENHGSTPIDAGMKTITSKWKWNENSMYFHATWRMDEPYPTFPLFDWNFLEAEGKGVIVGDEWTVLNPSEGWWGEGDEKIYVDDDFAENFPSHFGTGTEDYYGWAGGIVPTPRDEFAKPFHGNIIVGDPNSMGYNVCTRTRTLDAIPFSQKIKFDMEASCGTRLSSFFLQYTQTTFWYAAPGVKHNRKPLPEMASMPLPTLEGLQEKVKAAQKSQYVANGAIEAEFLPIVKKDKGVSENTGKFQVWGEISSGEMKNLWFEKEGDRVELKISEQFVKSDIQMCATVGQRCGIFDIYVNGNKQITQDFYSEHAGMTNPLINLGENEPVDNAFIISFVYKGESSKTGSKRGIGIDYFLIK